MSQASNPLFAVFVDGETKTGKGAAGAAIAQALMDNGIRAYYDIAGDFYRRYVAMVRRELELQETDSLPTGEPLQAAAQSLYDSRQAFAIDDTLGDLQRPAISESVAVLGELPIAQQAGEEWYAMSVQQAITSGANAIVLDGRNPRARVEEQLPELDVNLLTVLDLYMTCDADEAGRRVLLGQGVTEPTDDQFQAASKAVSDRRERDRVRAEHPFIVPTEIVEYDPAVLTAAEILAMSQAELFANPPATVILDNSSIAKPHMLAVVEALAVLAVQTAN